MEESVAATVLSGLALWVLLMALILGLSRVLRALVGIRSSLDKIAMGVRAIEQETSPLPGSIGGINSSFTSLAGGLESVKEHLESVNRNLDPVGKALAGS